MRIAVIIPTAHEEVALQRSLARVAQLSPMPDEIIVVDGAARQSCALLCRAAGAEWVPAHSARGGQLALGAAHARAEVLWFLDPGCEPPCGAVEAIRACIDSGAVGGYFRLRFAGSQRLSVRLLEQCVAWRCRCGTVYGEHGLFVTRAAYAATPGFTLQPIFEQVALVRALKRTGRFVALPLPITVSAARVPACRPVARRLLALGFACGVAPATLARWAGTAGRTGSAERGRQARGGTHEANEG